MTTIIIIIIIIIIINFIIYCYHYFLHGSRDAERCQNWRTCRMCFDFANDRWILLSLPSEKK